MKIFLFILAGVLLIVLYYGISFYKKIETSSSLVAKAKPFDIQSVQYANTMLVVGDSTAVGVGATSPSDTVAGRLARAKGFTYVENYAVSGSKTIDLASQIQKAKRTQYSLVLVQVGANDIIRFRSAKETGTELRQILEQLPAHDRLVLFTAGNVGGATIWPWFLKPFYTKLTLAYHKEFSSITTATNGVYVNLYTDPAQDPFVLQPDIYLSADGLHPSSEGYRVWFEKVVEFLPY